MTEHQPEGPAPSNIPELPPEPGGPTQVSGLTRFLERAAMVVVGPARRITDPQLFHKISLAAFLAWVGLGADGLSSSAYGPEAAFNALKGNTFLAIPLAILTALTVVIIAEATCASSSASRGRRRLRGGDEAPGAGAGLVSGSALLVDYVLTIAISLASCSESIFSLFPPDRSMRCAFHSRSCCWGCWRC